MKRDLRREMGCSLVMLLAVAVTAPDSPAGDYERLDGTIGSWLAVHEAPGMQAVASGEVAVLHTLDTRTSQDKEVLEESFPGTRFKVLTFGTKDSLVGSEDRHVGRMLLSQPDGTESEELGIFTWLVVPGEPALLVFDAQFGDVAYPRVTALLGSAGGSPTFVYGGVETTYFVSLDFYKGGVVE